MVDEPMVNVTCDRCGYTQDYELTALCDRSWDMRDLEKKLLKDGWRLTCKLEGETICDGCVDDEKAEREAEGEKGG